MENKVHHKVLQNKTRTVFSSAIKGYVRRDENKFVVVLIRGEEEFEAPLDIETETMDLSGFSPRHCRYFYTIFRQIQKSTNKKQWESWKNETT